MVDGDYVTSFYKLHLKAALMHYIIFGLLTL